ncbi:hypothetical protein RESH_00083 [Rhodopirellula europaea SH398]|uniref:Uncharacterized protein n=2 Tax=Rhodopirellula europaea TaxID=1263866 RepID=M5SCI9_9BACT|nr:hypothetical protein RE6C_04271 [Rhodopirellula europaea 6C]EMI29363.1 hypothetical protein RESH_00083 [Rhodopirellula europaea SH398]
MRTKLVDGLIEFVTRFETEEACVTFGPVPTQFRWWRVASKPLPANK